jgi:hypothetical protein
VKRGKNRRGFTKTLKPGRVKDEYTEIKPYVNVIPIALNGQASRLEEAARINSFPSVPGRYPKAGGSPSDPSAGLIKDSVPDTGV